MTQVSWTMDINEYGETRTMVGMDYFRGEEKHGFDKDDWQDFYDDLVHLDLSTFPESEFLKLASGHSGFIIDFTVMGAKNYLDSDKEGYYKGLSEESETLHQKLLKEYKLIVELPYFFKVGLAEDLDRCFREKYPNIILEDLEDIVSDRLDDCGDYIISFKTTQEISEYKAHIDYALSYSVESKDRHYNSGLGLPYEEVNIETLSDLNGITAILEGDYSLGEQQTKIVKLFQEEEKDLKVITDLYKSPEKLKKIVDCDNLIIQTTGYNPELGMLIETFSKLGYEPKRVFFLIEVIDLTSKLNLKSSLYSVSMIDLEVKFLKKGA